MGSGCIGFLAHRGQSAHCAGGIDVADGDPVRRAFLAQQCDKQRGAERIAAEVLEEIFLDLTRAEKSAGSEAKKEGEVSAQ